jgi:hypothetical protein
MVFREYLQINKEKTQLDRKMGKGLNWWFTEEIKETNKHRGRETRL